VATTLKGPDNWSLDRDKDGFRTYKIRFKVRSDDKEDGPTVVEGTVGLPADGDTWDWFGDVNPNAVCTAERRIFPRLEEEPYIHWHVECTYTERPLPNCQADRQQVIEDPILEPVKISVSSSNTRVEATHDRNNFPLLNSAFEQLRGPTVEFDEWTATVRISRNITYFDTALYAGLLNCVNSEPLWGNAARRVRFTEVTAERKFKANCDVYWTVEERYEINPRSHDRDIPDFGTKALRGQWISDAQGVRAYVVDTVNGIPADPKNPWNFQQFKGPKGDNESTFLNGAGLPARVPVAIQGYFISITSGNVDNPLEDFNNWLPIRSQLDPANGNIKPGNYNTGDSIIYGQVVRFQDTRFYVALISEPTAGPPTSGSNAEWLLLFTVASASTPYPPTARKGLYNGATSYNAGDYVDGLYDETSSYSKLVQYYREEDLEELLELPADLNNP
jgi:hypothetical protein